MDESGTKSARMLPDAEHTHVDRSKIVDYLLCSAHPDGNAKAKFFERFGFTPVDWQELARALCLVGTSNPVVAAIESPHGVRYTVDGPLKTPDGRSPWIRTVWIVAPDSPSPRLVTAYPA